MMKIERSINSQSINLRNSISIFSEYEYEDRHGSNNTRHWGQKNTYNNGSPFYSAKNLYSITIAAIIAAFIWISVFLSFWAIRKQKAAFLLPQLAYNILSMIASLGAMFTVLFVQKSAFDDIMPSMGLVVSETLKISIFQLKILWCFKIGFFLSGLLFAYWFFSVNIALYRYYRALDAYRASHKTDKVWFETHSDWINFDFWCSITI